MITLLCSAIALAMTCGLLLLWEFLVSGNRRERKYHSIYLMRFGGRGEDREDRELLDEWPTEIIFEPDDSPAPAPKETSALPSV